jgi:hypothetical protein
MHTVYALEEAIEFAERLGYRIRQEWLGGTGGGACEFNGQKWLFVDLALNVVEQLEQVVTALREDPSLPLFQPPASLRKLLDVRHVA